MLGIVFWQAYNKTRKRRNGHSFRLKGNLADLLELIAQDQQKVCVISGPLEDARVNSTLWERHSLCILAWFDRDGSQACARRAIV